MDYTYTKGEAIRCGVMNELKRAFAYTRDYRMVRVIENKIEDLSKTSYRRYKRSVDNLITNME